MIPTWSAAVSPPPQHRERTVGAGSRSVKSISKGYKNEYASPIDTMKMEETFEMKMKKCMSLTETQELESLNHLHFRKEAVLTKLTHPMLMCPTIGMSYFSGILKLPDMAVATMT